VTSSPGKKVRRGRPPAGVRDDELVSEYPQLSIRVPADVQQRLRGLSLISGRPQWRVLADAVEAFVQQQPPDTQQLLAELLNRASPVLAMPTRSPKNYATPAASILNVDDNESMLFARSAILRNEGFEVVEAKTGRAALEILEKQRPDIMVLDVHLPDMSGLDVCRAVKSRPELRDVKVIQVSATFSSPTDQLHGLETGGADIYLAEPIPRGTLLSVVRRLLAS
jgi:CheY-like chemotaxis protein